MNKTSKELMPTEERMLSREDEGPANRRTSADKWPAHRVGKVTTAVAAAMAISGAAVTIAAPAQAATGNSPRTTFEAPTRETMAQAAFFPSQSTAGTPAKLVYFIRGDAGAAQTSWSFSDVLPAGITVEARTSTCSGDGSLSVEGRQTVVHEHGTVPGNGCGITYTVTAQAPGTYIDNLEIADHAHIDVGWGLPAQITFSSSVQAASPAGPGQKAPPALKPPAANPPKAPAGSLPHGTGTKTLPQTAPSGSRDDSTKPLSSQQTSGSPVAAATPSTLGAPAHFNKPSSAGTSDRSHAGLWAQTGTSRATTENITTADDQSAWRTCLLGLGAIALLVLAATALRRRKA